MAAPQQRRPGQGNEDDDRAREQANAEFLGTSSLYGGGDPTWAVRLFRWLRDRRDKRSST